jgi:hypothetical protein
MEFSGQLYTLAALPPGKQPCIFRVGECVGSRANIHVVEKRGISCLETQLPCSPAHKPVAIPTELSLLLEYLGKLRNEELHNLHPSPNVIRRTLIINEFLDFVHRSVFWKPENRTFRILGVSVPRWEERDTLMGPLERAKLSRSF